MLVTHAIAGWLLAESPRTRTKATLVGAGLLVGNWGLVQLVAMVSLWSVNGFAP